ncbi:flagellum-specific ATP synthase FliI [Vibrio variabilis]|uniref:Flagellum-specific ATP synthase FliI n=1 Tax=Vibrio variabilis TaxID=990271 RepID=A0ABQ0J8N1_9VIBR|nr:flagellum-specific ATP synthase FliI [Vibrio variabilis]
MSNVSPLLKDRVLKDRLFDAIASLDTVPVARVTGRLVKVNGLMLQAVGCRFKLEQRCLVETDEGDMIEAQVVGFDHNIAYLMPVRRLGGLFAGAKVVPLDGDSSVNLGTHWLGRVVNGLGEALDDGPRLKGGERVSLELNRLTP